MLRGVEPATIAQAGDEVDVVFDRTPFYAEGGGQVGDRGFLETADAQREVVDTQKLGAAVAASRDGDRRARSSVGDARRRSRSMRRVRAGAEQAHTATHVLHHTLRDVLGEHVRQMGSLVEPGRLRFDFAHFSAVDPDSLGGDRGDHQRPRRPTTTSSSRSRRATGRRSTTTTRWRSSKRSTGTSYASSGSATTPSSCAAARTSTSTGNIGFVKVLGGRQHRLEHPARRSTDGCRGTEVGE